jgi:predicted ferric reductase
MAVSSPPRLYLLLSSVIFICIKLSRLSNIIYLNVSLGHRSIATVKHHNDCVQISVELARHLDFRPGQYIYLSLWNLSGGSAFEYHPFQICWVYTNHKKRQVLELLVQARRGFTRRLLNEKRGGYLAFVEGPYGQHLSLDRYGTVLLFATDLGIAGQLPFIRELLKLYKERKARTQRIALFWELDIEGDECSNENMWPTDIDARQNLGITYENGWMRCSGKIKTTCD